jgi:hypothetical protein
MRWTDWPWVLNANAVLYVWAQVIAPVVMTTWYAPRRAQRSAPVGGLAAVDVEVAAECGPEAALGDVGAGEVGLVDADVALAGVDADGVTSVEANVDVAVPPTPLLLLLHPATSHTTDRANATTMARNILASVAVRGGPRNAPASRSAKRVCGSSIRARAGSARVR